MNRKVASKVLVSVVLVAIFVGCATEPRYEGLKSGLPKLTRFVEIQVRRHVPDDQLVSRAIEGKPEWPPLVRDMNIQVRHGKKLVVLLVSPKDSKYALFEDISSTQYVDNDWRNQRHPIEFTIDVLSEETVLAN